MSHAAYNYESDDSMPSLGTVSESTDNEDTFDVEMSENQIFLPHPLSSGSTSGDEPMSRPPSSIRNSRRARVEEDEDEDVMRETNRQRMHPPVPEDAHDHHFHPDIHDHAQHHAQQQQPPNGHPPLLSRVTYVVDILPPAVVPPPTATATAAGQRPQPTGARGAPPIFYPFGPAGFHFHAAPGGAPANAEGGTNVPDTDGQHAGTNFEHDFNIFVQGLLQMNAMPWAGFFNNFEEQEDPERAKKLLTGLEEVPEGLVKRMEIVGSDEGEKPVCAVCFDGLLDPEAGTFGEENKEEEADYHDGDRTRAEDSAHMEVEAEPMTTSSAPSPTTSDEQAKFAESVKHKVIVLPCSHVFHASCLLPWFTRPHRTTCPTCRFDIDPDSLTLSVPVGNRRARPRPPHQAPAGPGAGQPIPAADGTGATHPNPVHTPFGGDMPLPIPPPQAGHGPRPHVHGRGTSFRIGEMPFGFIVDVNIFPGHVPPQQQQGQGAVPGHIHLPRFGPPPQQTPAQPANPANADANTPGASARPRPFNPGMAGLGPVPVPVGMFAGPALFEQFLFGPQPPPPSGPAHADTEPVDPARAAAAEPQPPQPPRPPTATANAGATLADLLGLGRFEPQPGAGAQAQEPLPSFEEFVNLVGQPAPPMAQAPPPDQPPATEGAHPQPQSPPLRQWQGFFPGGQAGSPEAEAQMNVMLDDIATSLFQQMFPGIGGARRPTGAAGAQGATDAPPVPPGPIPFNIPPHPRQRPSPQTPSEKRQWAPPPPPGPTLRERVEKKEREMGLRCSDISCGLGPSDEDPRPVVDPREMRQVHIHPLQGQGEGKESVCDHIFHPACLVSAERVAGWSGADQKKEVEGDEEEVQVSCPACRAVGCISRIDWDEGACALA